MIKTAILAFAGMMIFSAALAQDVKTLQENARNYEKDGDFNNAILVLNKAHDQEPNNLAVSKDLAYAYFTKGDYPKMQNLMQPLLEKEDADADIFQLGGMLYRVINDNKEAEKVYKKGLKSFPNSGPLLNDYGELLWDKQDYTAIKQWEHGIQTDPTYTSNYYNASKYYYFTKDKVWSLIYGELFV